MGQHQAEIHWQRQENEEFTNSRFSRTHEWRFDGGLVVPASTAPTVVPIPYSDPSLIDPEEAFIASAASCHMLFFLALAAKKGHIIDRYTDLALGTLAENEQGQMAITEICLQPKVIWHSVVADDIGQQLHQRSHELCFIANSMKTTIIIRPTFSYTA